MRILIIPFGSHGDVHPLVGIGEALRRRGHDVHVIVSPHFAELVSAAGLVLEPLGTDEDFREILEHPDLWKPRKAFYVVAEGMKRHLEPCFETIERLHRPGETILVGGSLAFAARIANEALGIPLATVHLQPGVMISVEEPPYFPELRINKDWPRWFKRLILSLIHSIVDRVLGTQLNAFRARWKLPPMRRVMDEWWNSPDLVLGMFPEWFAPPASDWPKQLTLVGFPLYDESHHRAPDPELEGFLAAGDPPIVFTFGSAMTQGHDVFAMSVEACERLGKRGLFLARFRDQIPDPLPSTIRYFSYIPFSQVFPRAAAVVQHGGIGTTAQALAAGIPQLIVALAHDQFDNGSRVEKLGCGRLLPRRKYTASTATSALKTLLESPEVRRAAQACAARTSGSFSIARACELIENLGPDSPIARSKPAPTEASL
jgi:rhamnosyltransferase subunit B